MPSAIAFFPWVAIDEPRTIGSVRLLPYARGRLPGNTTYVSQKDIDAILRAYTSRKNKVIENATLMEFGRWHSGQEVKHRLDALFRVRELVAFSALSKRSLFRHSDYCNFDTYALTVQQYSPGSAGAFSFFTRRRDGSTRYLWDSKEFAFQRPLHVDLGSKLSIDENLLDGLLKADKARQLSFEAIVEFNRANTDSSDMPLHMEVVLAKSAFEFFFQIGNKRDDFIRALSSAIVPRMPIWPSGPLQRKWTERFPRATRPLDAWAREFCDLRGGAAHGKHRGGGRFVWSEASHLAFVSVIFPLLVKNRLSRQGFMNPVERDSIHLQLCESYLMRSPFSNRQRAQTVREHPWSRIYSEEVLGELMRRNLAKSIRPDR